MKKARRKKTAVGVTVKKDKYGPSPLKKNRIEQLKEMINNEEYLNEAISKLAKSLTTGLMK